MFYYRHENTDTEDRTQTDLACVAEQLVARTELFLHFFKASAGKLLGDEMCDFGLLGLETLLGTRRWQLADDRRWHSRGEDDDDDNPLPSTRLLDRLRCETAWKEANEENRGGPLRWRHGALAHVLEMFPALVTVGRDELGDDEGEDDEQERGWWVAPVISPTPAQVFEQAARVRELRRSVEQRYVRESAQVLEEARARFARDSARLQKLS